MVKFHFRGCSLMVKPQSSKLITRVRFPSSPPLQRLRRKRRGLLRCGDERESLPGENTFPRALGIFALQPVIPSRTVLNKSAGIPSARSSSSSPPQIPAEVAGTFTLQLVIPSRTVLNKSAGIPSARSSSSSPPQIPAEVAGIFALQPVIPSPRIHTKHPTKPRETGEYAHSGNKPRTSRCVGHLAGKQVN